MAREPQRFGKYLLLERISVGGMAEVFKAKAFGVEGFEKILAIKRILPNMVEDSDFIEMFIDEAKIAGQLNHANICQIYELGRFDKAHYIAMEYISGKDLLQIMTRFERKGERIPVPIAAYIISKLCEGLDYAHRKQDLAGNPLNIVHRDVSPQNVLVSYDGQIKLIDFGIAKARYRSAKTAAGVLKGKFGYMSPEQVRGLRLDRRSDIFSLGTLLYEMVTGTRLFAGETDFAVLEKVRNGEIRPPRQVNPELSPEFEAVLLKALSLTPEGRYGWASEFQEALAKVVLRRSAPMSPKRLAAWMREHFRADIERELSDHEHFLRLGPDGKAPPEQVPQLPAFDAFDDDDEETALMKGAPQGAAEGDFNDIETLAQTPSALAGAGDVPMAEILDEDEPPGEDATVILWSEEEEESEDGATMILPDDGVGLPANAQALLHPDEDAPPEGATVILPEDEDAPPEGATVILPEDEDAPPEGATLILPDADAGASVGLSIDQVQRDAAAANAALAAPYGASSPEAAAGEPRAAVQLPGDLPPPRADDDPFGLRLGGQTAPPPGPTPGERTGDTAKTAKPARRPGGVRSPVVAVIALAAAVVAGGIVFVLRAPQGSGASGATAPRTGAVVVGVQPPVLAMAHAGMGVAVKGKVPGVIVLEGLPAGTNEVRVDAPGYLPAVLSVTVEPGRIQAVGPARLRPRKKPSTLRVRLSEMFLDAEVRLDGRVLTPAEVAKPIPLPVDRTVELRVSVLGYLDHVEKIRTGHGRRIQTKPIELAPDPRGQVSIHSVPPGAKVWVNGTLQRCVTPCRVTDLNPKERFKVRLALQGYRDYRAVYRFPKDESTRTITVSLKRLAARASGAAPRTAAVAEAPRH